MGIHAIVSQLRDARRTRLIRSLSCLPHLLAKIQREDPSLVVANLKVLQVCQILWHLVHGYSPNPAAFTRISMPTS